MAINLNGTGSITGLSSISAPVISGVPAGTASAPAFSFTGDSNTGVYSPGADQLAISTNGTGRLFIDGSGRVGVGTGSPQGRFESAAGDSTDYAIVANNTLSSGGEQNYISLNAGATRMGSISRSVNDIAIKAHQASLSFWTGTAGSPTQKAVIDSSGRVGIGTSSPGSALDVRGEIRGGNGTIIGGISYSSRTEIGSLSNHDLGFISNSTTRMLLDTSGRLGIGTTSPGTTLEVNGGCQITGSASGFSGGEVRLGATTADLQHGISTQSTGSPILFFDHRGTGNTGIFAWRVGTNGASERMRIDSSGRLLVGTSSKSATASTTAKGIVGIGGGGALICAEGQIANNGTIDITVSTGGFHYFSGLLQVNNIDSGSGTVRTQSLISVLGNTQFGNFSTSTLHTANGGAGASFTITYVATGIIRFTNTSGATCNVQLSYTGGGINAT